MDQPPGGASAPRGLAYVIKQLDLALRPRLADACQTGGLSSAQYTALSVLTRRPGITSSELARRSFVRAQTMATTLDPLLEAGLIRRERDPGHGRRRLLFLTDAGRERITGVTPAVGALEDEMVAGLSSAERDQLGDLLRRCRNALSDEHVRS